MLGWSTASQSERIAVLAFGGIMLSFLGSFGAVMIWRHQADQRRLAIEPHVRGTILSFRQNRDWIRAVVEFTRTQDGSKFVCRTEVSLKGNDFQIGQAVAVVPRADSCGQPAVSKEFPVPD